MAIQNGYYIIEGWVSRAELYFGDSLINDLPIQSDMINGRRWYRLANTSDIVSPVKLIDTPIGSRYAYGGVMFKWLLQGLSPKGVKYIQDTFFAPPIGNSSFYQRAWSNKLTLQTYNRASGAWETYHTISKMANLLDEAEPSQGGFNNLQITNTAVKLAPDGPDISISASYNTFTQMLYQTFFVSLDNVGDTNTFDNTHFTYQLPLGVTLISINNSNWDSSIEYSINDGNTWTSVAPSPITNTTNIRIGLDVELNVGEDTGNFIITIRPSEDITSFTNVLYVKTNGDTLETGNNVSSSAVPVNIFTPLALNPLLWLDADEQAYEQIGGEIPVFATTDGVVDGWRDLSGNNNRYVQTTQSRRPLYRVNQQNGKPAIDFDGVDDRLTSTSFVSTPTTENTTFVFLINATNSSSTALYEPLYSTNMGSIWAHKANFGGLDEVGLLFGTEGFPQDWVELGNANSGLQMLGFVTNEGDVSFYRNTILVNTGTGINNLTGIRSASIGGSLMTPNAFFDGLIYEIVGYNRTLNTNDRQAIEYYLINKYNL